MSLQIALGSMDILTTLILLIHERRLSFHLFVSSSISFINVLQFSVNRSFTSLVTFMLSHFILFDVILSGTVFLISHPGSSLLAYRNATDFYILILFPAT